MLQLSGRHASYCQELRVPQFLSLTDPARARLHSTTDLHVNGVSLTLRVTLELFSSKRKGPVSSLPSPRPTELPSPYSRRGKENLSPAGARSSVVAGSPRNGRSTYSNSPSSSVMTKKCSGLRDLYSRGGIESVIYGDEDNLSSPRTARAAPTTPKSAGLPFEETDIHDVVIDVACLKSSVPQPLLRLVQLKSGIGDREEQKRVLDVVDTSDDSGSLCSWRGTLVPRISLKTYGLIDAQGALNAWLEINLPEEVLESVPSNSLQTLSQHLASLLHEDGCASADALLVTSDGGKLPAHLPILRSRSSLLSSAKILNQSECDIGIIVDGRLPVNVHAKSKQSVKWGIDTDSDLNTSLSDEHDDVEIIRKLTRTTGHSSPHTTPSKRTVTSGKTQTSANKINKATPTRVRTPPVKPSSREQTPQRVKLLANRNPSKNCLTSSRSPRKAPPKAGTSPARMALFRPKQFQDNTLLSSSDTSCQKDLNQCFIDESSVNESLTSHLGLRRNQHNHVEDDEQLLDHFSHLSTKDLKDGDKYRKDYENIQNLNNKVLIKVNMSTSVTKEFLTWIYTGTSLKLSSLCRPLLAAGRRHGVPELAVAAERHLMASLSAATVVQSLVLAFTYSAPALEDRALTFICDRASDITNTDQWERAMDRCPQLALKLTRKMASCAAT